MPTETRPMYKIEPKDGGLAFPVSVTMPDGSVAVERGMSLRDSFAAKAMLGAIASAAQGFNGMSDQDMAAYSYALADAMLAERAK